MNLVNGSFTVAQRKITVARDWFHAQGFTGSLNRARSSCAQTPTGSECQLHMHSGSGSCLQKEFNSRAPHTVARTEVFGSFTSSSDTKLNKSAEEIELTPIYLINQENDYIYSLIHKQRFPIIVDLITAVEDTEEPLL
jgi:hypothetical protein